MQNNPIRYNDPTGHYEIDPECTNPNDCIKRSKGGGRGSGGGGGPTPPIETPSGEPEIFGTPSANFCDTIPNPSSTIYCQPKPDWLTQEYYPPYDPSNSLFAQYRLSAFMVGANAGYGAGSFTPMGVEALFMIQDGKPDLSGFGYFGQGVGGGAEASLYGGAVFNLNTPDEYRGDFMTYNITFEPISLSYFHDARSKILKPGAVQGFSIGKGFGVSISGTNTNFSKGFELKWP